MYRNNRVIKRGNCKRPYIRDSHKDLMSYYALFCDNFNLTIDDVFPHLKNRVDGDILPLFLDPTKKCWYLVYCIGDHPGTQKLFREYVQWYIENVFTPSGKSFDGQSYMMCINDNADCGSAECDPAAAGWVRLAG